MNRKLVLLWKHPVKLSKNVYGNLDILIKSKEYQKEGPEGHKPQSYWYIYNRLSENGQYEDKWCVIKRCDVVKTEKRRCK